MEVPSRWTLLIGVVVLGAVYCSPLPLPGPSYDARLSSLELAIIKCIVETVPGISGGSYDWSVIHSRSKELQGAEIEVVQVRQRDPDFTGRSGEASSGYPNDWNIVRSVSGQLATRVDGPADTQTNAGEGFSDDWAIVRSISTELHLGVEQAPGDGYNEPAYQPPVEQASRDGFQVRDMAVNQLISQGEYTSVGVDDSPIDIRLKSSNFDSENIKETQQTYSDADKGIENVAIGTSEHQQSFGNGKFAHQSSSGPKSERGEIGWSIVRSISSEQEPIIEEISSPGNQETISSTVTQGEGGDGDSYNVVQPILTDELQPADKEAEHIPASLTELSPPSEEQSGSSWNSQATDDAQASEVPSPGTDTLEVKEPCETGHRRIKDVCRKVFTFQLNSHLK